MCSGSPCPAAAPQPNHRRRRLKCILLWAARRLISGDGYAGPLEVEVKIPTESDSAIYRSTPDVDGLTAPSGVRVEASDSAAAPNSLPPAPELVRTHFFGDEDRTILRELAAREPCQAIDVQQAVASLGVARSSFWPAWKQLQVRLLVIEVPGGFRLGPPWLRSLIGLVLLWGWKVKLGGLALFRELPV